MADAVPVNSTKTPKTPKGASAGVPKDVLEGVSMAPEKVVADDTFKGGVKLQSHDAVREDF